MIGRKSALWLAAAISVLTLATVPAAASAEDELPCNTAVELCGKTLDQVVLPGTHNSMSNEEYEWALPNQIYSIPTQLEMGIRALLIDTHYGKLNENGTVSDWKSGVDGNPHEVGAQTFLCHSLCTIGASDLTSELAKVSAFLDANPREVLVFVVQNGIHPDDYAEAVTASGLINHVYTGATTSYPTLRDMIAADQRVVMLSEGNTGTVPWFHDGYAGPLQETPYDFREDEVGTPLNTQQGVDQLTTASSLDSTCRPNRGGQTGGLFLMNHWVNGKLVGSDPVSPDHAVAKILNAKDVLVNRARACETRRGKLPTIVAVDQFGDGDLLGAVDELNGVDRSVIPGPDPIGPRVTVRKPKNVQVKAGRVAAFRITLRNTGDRTASKVKVCAKAPKRLAKSSRCVLVTLNPAQTKTAVVKVATKPTAKGKGSVTFTIGNPKSGLTTKANLTVKAKKKAKSKRR